MVEPQTPDFVELLVRQNAGARSWREKLDVVRQLLADEARELTGDDLATVAIYLRFLSTGEIACEEDGRHFRPSHHARLATQIHTRLARVEIAGNAFLVRKIQACLPSTAEPFQRAEPLTRIRDIAHRNDIPQELKREIKTTLQNKLHRCAGPEDLVTSAGLLERITAPGTDYSADFVEQFQIFHGELCEFFNASSLEDRLSALATDDATRELVARFLEQKHHADLQAALKQLTDLRRHLLTLGNQPDLRLTDIALEDFAFVLISEILNRDSDWNAAFDTLEQALANLEMSGIEPEEAAAILAELKSGRRGFSAEGRDGMLRLKATVDRARRLAGDFSDTVLAQFAARAEKLGGMLGVPSHAAKVFAEAEIRAHLVFQLAKLTSLLLRRIRDTLNQAPWDVLVAGNAAGRLIKAALLGDLSPCADPQVVLLEQASGDEEIPSHVTGILLAHDLPHLSHLGVRARQAGVILASCEEISLWGDLLRHAGEWVSFRATSEGVQVEPTSEGMATMASPRTVSTQIPEVNLNPEANVVPVETIHATTGGNKSDGARLLLELAASSGEFTAPPGLVVPFGVMEKALQRDAAIQAECAELIGRLNPLPPEAFAVATARIRALVSLLPVPDEIHDAVVNAFGPEQQLAVRSSANSEDLPEMAGAGLHESVAGVTAATVVQAVSDVWASLWTERAAASRRQAGIPHGAAHMAVLIQPLVEPELSFILHTVHPVSHDPRECYVELAVGLGETLAGAATRGSPFRLTCDKDTGQVTMLAFANFSHALEAGTDGRLVRRRLDYSREPFTVDAAFREKLGARLARVARFLERALGVPQDVEGVLRGGEIVLVQSRAQQGISPTA